MNINKLPIAALALLMIIGLASCEKGPAETAGERIDNAAENAGDRIEDATDNAGDKMEEAGDKIEDKTD
jgi:hypothetical protein